MNDQLQELVEILKDFTKSTAVYIGKLETPKRRIQEDDDDKAHIDDDAQKIIHFLNASKGHEFLVDAVLRQDQGLTYDVFKDTADNENAEEQQ